MFPNIFHTRAQIQVLRLRESQCESHFLRIAIKFVYFSIFFMHDNDDCTEPQNNKKNCFFIISFLLYQTNTHSKNPIDRKSATRYSGKKFIKNCFLVYSWWWFLVHALYANISHTSLSVRNFTVISSAIFIHPTNDNSYMLILCCTKICIWKDNQSKVLQ